MPSPFPGMDPYLEDPAIWPDFHDGFAAEIRAALNVSLPSDYYARLESRPEIGIIEGDERRLIVPDVSISRSPRPTTMPALEPDAGTAVAVIGEPRIEPSESIRLVTTIDPIRHHWVEIRDAKRGHALVTLIEIVSPSNKRAGDDRKSYQKKQRQVLGSEANLIEVDLHSVGEPVVGVSSLIGFTSRLGRDGRYLVCISRAWERSPETEYELYPFGLTECLPCIEVPLRQGEKEILLDLQFVLQQAYDGGPYRRGAIDYRQPPEIPLTDDEQQWVRERVVAAFPKAAEGDS